MNKKIIYFIIIVFLISFVGFWSIISGGYDNQNKVILFLKKVIPANIARKARDYIFIIPDLKEKNKFLELQVKKYEQGYEGQLFKTETIKSKNENNFVSLKEFFLPFPRLDLRLGWDGVTNSKRAHYLELVDENVFVISGLGETIFFKKKNIFTKKLKQKKIKNNIKEILDDNNAELIGIRDLFYEDQYLYISLLFRNNNGVTINIYRAKANTQDLIFETFFKINEFWQQHNIFTGGRIEKFEKNKILFSVGFSKEYEKAQIKESFLGKIISIDKKTRQSELISYGHRNQQGLFYFKDQRIVMNTEHGPKGGDEINFNYLNESTTHTPNYGWPISSYGKPYPSEEVIFEKKKWLSKTHKENGFNEPIKYFTPSIGISELIFLQQDKERDENKIYLASLRAGSLYILSLNESLDKVSNLDRIYFNNQRIRDLKYDPENKLFFAIFEFTPSVAILKLN